MIFIGSVCGQREPRKLQDLLVILCISCNRTIVTLFFLTICWTMLSLAVVRPSTLSCSNTKPGFSKAIGVAAHPNKDTKLGPGIAVYRLGEVISLSLSYLLRI